MPGIEKLYISILGEGGSVEEYALSPAAAARRCEKLGLEDVFAFFALEVAAASSKIVKNGDASAPSGAAMAAGTTEGDGVAPASGGSQKLTQLAEGGRQLSFL